MKSFLITIIGLMFVLQSCEPKKELNNELAENKKVYELNKTEGSAVKQITSDIKYILLIITITSIALVIGYRQNKKEE